MSGPNGHLPDGAKVITLAQLTAANRKYVKVPGLSARLGEDVYVRIRAIRRAAYVQMLPPPPPGSESWKDDGRAEQLLAWLASLPDGERAQRQRDLDEVTYKVVAAGMVEPAVSVDEARDWADDADVIAVEILRFSGMLPEVAPEQPAETPASA